MRLFVVFLPLALAAAFLLGRASNPSAAGSATATHVYTGRLYDVFRVPGAAVRCEVGAEAGSQKLSCEHVPYARARFEVVYARDNVLVFRLGNPHKPVWSARGRP
jgi:hypothetical protein